MNTVKRVLITSCMLIFCFSFTCLLPNDSYGAKGKSHIFWNNSKIKWHSYNSGLAKAKRQGRPTIIVFYANWCPTCQKYGKVFKDKEVIKAAKGFIMIRVNIDKNPKLNAKYGFDGKYVPRTVALYPDGKVMHQLYPNKKSKYYIGLDPYNLLWLMRMANKQI